MKERTERKDLLPKRVWALSKGGHEAAIDVKAVPGVGAAYALKQLITSGVRLFVYLEDRERSFDSPTDKLLMSVTAFADELEREKARQRGTADGRWMVGRLDGGRRQPAFNPTPQHLVHNNLPGVIGSSLTRLPVA